MLINFSKLDIVTIILNKKGNILWWGIGGKLVVHGLLY
ncbi:hypothetical protein Nizo3892_0125 [Lactiplantibacillus plantarum]|nr:hypothetical protein LpDm1_2478 [Lactiplantibacillus plantarum]KZU12681.1 hypothetical protein CNW10_2422 [Lactiplantibacillus plantarum]KZU29952.1 hypothetical protein Nizo2535_1997 [Lactiplantibacillus plantarum]KZU41877.1 hypothetical protein Nizo2757_2102 [Lactiplantibacillus plantarum]KZU84303.1 hypothetical protein Nizo3892_0125 [Lactiplantibacillus plantarum]